MLAAKRVLAAEGINLTAVEAFKVVGMFLPTKRAQHQQHAQTWELFRGVHLVLGSSDPQEFPIGR